MGHGRQPRAGLDQPSDGSNRLKMGDDFGYFNEVKEEFKDAPEKYGQFLAIMEDLEARRLDRADGVARLRYLFKGHRSLLLGLNALLPKGYEIVIPAVENPEERQLNGDEALINKAVKFVNKVKTRFQASTEYKTFLRILNEYRKGTKPLAEVYREVEELFNNQPDLVAEFKDFLPSATPFPNFDEAINFVNKIRFQASTEYKTFLCIVGEYGEGTKSVAEVYREVNELLYDQRDLMEEFNEFLPSDQKLGNKVEKERVENMSAHSRD